MIEGGGTVGTVVGYDTKEGLESVTNESEDEKKTAEWRTEAERQTTTR